MSDGKKPRGLGRGLSALLGDESEDYAALDRVRATRSAPVEALRPSRFQPRRRFDPEELDALARSIAEKGMLQPILVRRDLDAPGGFEIIAGERRWRAAQLAQLHEVPIVVRELDDREALEVALVENLQRQDLSPLEEAQGYRRLMEEFAHSQEALAKSVGKSRSHVANTLRLLNLPDAVKALVDDGQLTAGHARALLAAADPEATARRVVAEGLNVRQTEQLVAGERRGPESDAGDAGVPVAADRPPRREAGGAATPKDVDTLALERDLGTLLGLGVEIRFHGRGGTLLLHYATLDQLDDILLRLRQGRPATGLGEGDAEPWDAPSPLSE